MVVGGLSEKTTEVLDFENFNFVPEFGELPTNHRRSVGGLIGDTMIICGNRPATKSCLTFKNHKWTETHTMTSKRFGHASVQLDSERIWILGGKEKENGGFLDTTEFIQLNRTVGTPGPKLPYALVGMCAVKVAEDKIFVIGGDNGDKKTEFVSIFNPQDEFSYIEGPPLQYARFVHSCGLMKDEKHSYLVIAGGFNAVRLASIEILNLTTLQWSLGMGYETNKIKGVKNISFLTLQDHNYHLKYHIVL